MLLNDAVASAQAALYTCDRSCFISSVRVAQTIAEGDIELIALLDAAIARFPSQEAFEAALECIVLPLQVEAAQLKAPQLKAPQLKAPQLEGSA